METVYIVHLAVSRKTAHSDEKINRTNGVYASYESAKAAMLAAVREVVRDCHMGIPAGQIVASECSVSGVCECSVCEHTDKYFTAVLSYVYTATVQP